MKKGDVVMVYEDPFTRQKREGVARLVKCLRRDDEYERWIVQFDGDGERQFFERVIVPEKDDDWETYSDGEVLTASDT